MDKLDIESFYKGKRVIVTGDTGFKGSWLTLWLHSMGAEVLGYALPPDSDSSHFSLLKLDDKIKHVDGNILDYDFLIEIFEKFKPQIVFHLAAQALVRQSYDDPKKTFETNVSGSVNVLEAIRVTKSVRALVYITSDKCYKNNEWIWGYREIDELGGYDPYSASKAAAEVVFSSYMDSFFKVKDNFGAASARAGNVLGGGDWALNRIIPDFIRSVKNNQPLKIRYPNSTRPWQHVLEPLSGYLLLGKRLFETPDKFSGSWNFGPDFNSVKSVSTLVETCIDLFGEGRIVYDVNDDIKHEAGLLHLNCDKANHQLNWHAVWDFDKSVTQTVNWYKEYFNGGCAVELSLNDILNYKSKR
jgi:CDP-glucose 4,6-dehydratase